MLRLCVFLNLRFYEYNGQYKADEQYFKFWIKLANKVSHMTLCVPTRMNSKKGLHKVDFNPQRISICPLPMYKNSFELYFKFPYIALLSTRKCIEPLRESHILVSVVPNILGLWLNTIASLIGVFPVLYVRGNLVNTVKFEYRRSCFAFLPVALANFLDKLARRQMKKYLTFVVGDELYQRYLSYDIKTVPIVTSLIQQNDLKEFVPKSQMREEIVLLTVGRLSPERGIGTLLETLDILKNSRQRFVCKIIGDGPHHQYLKQKTRDLSLNNVTFTGYIPYGPEIINEYRQADIFVLPSYTEGFPKVILEAMANGVPIVSTSVGGIPHVIKSGYNGILVPPQDAVSLAEAITQLASDIDLYNRIGINASRTIQGLTFERQSEIFLQNLSQYFETNRCK